MRRSAGIVAHLDRLAVGDEVECRDRCARRREPDDRPRRQGARVPGGLRRQPRARHGKPARSHSRRARRSGRGRVGGGRRLSVATPTRTRRAKSGRRPSACSTWRSRAPAIGCILSAVLKEAACSRAAAALPRCCRPRCSKPRRGPVAWRRVAVAGVLRRDPCSSRLQRGARRRSSPDSALIRPANSPGRALLERPTISRPSTRAEHPRMRRCRCVAWRGGEAGPAWPALSSRSAARLAGAPAARPNRIARASCHRRRRSRGRAPDAGRAACFVGRERRARCCSWTSSSQTVVAMYRQLARRSRFARSVRLGEPSTRCRSRDEDGVVGARHHRLPRPSRGPRHRPRVQDRTAAARAPVTGVMYRRAAERSFQVSWWMRGSSTCISSRASDTDDRPRDFSARTLRYCAIMPTLLAMSWPVALKTVT